MAFLDAAHASLAPEGPDIKITLKTKEALGGVLGLADPTSKFAQLLALHSHPSEAKVALRRTKGPVGGCIDFHCDQARHMDPVRHTVQLTLNDDSAYDGGRLCFFTSEAGLLIPARPAGTLTKHDGGILHGVTRLHAGVRCSLFVVDEKNGLGEKDVFILSASQVHDIKQAATQRMVSAVDDAESARAVLLDAQTAMMQGVACQLCGGGAGREAAPTGGRKPVLRGELCSVSDEAPRRTRGPCRRHR